MKIKDNYVLQEIVDEYLVVPIAEESDRLHGVIRLNETGAFLWKKLSEEEKTKEELVQILLSEYNADQSKILDDVDKYLSQLKAIGCLED